VRGGMKENQDPPSETEGGVHNGFFVSLRATRQDTWVEILRRVCLRCARRTCAPQDDKGFLWGDRSGKGAAVLRLKEKRTQDPTCKDGMWGTRQIPRFADSAWDDKHACFSEILVGPRVGHPAYLDEIKHGETQDPGSTNRNLGHPCVVMVVLEVESKPRV
jgi:hypothetical protein